MKLNLALTSSLCASFLPSLGAVWAVTMALIAATCVIVDDNKVFIFVVVTLLFILPTWRYASQSYKRRLDGPWSLPTNLLESSHSRTTMSGNGRTL